MFTIKPGKMLRDPMWEELSAMELLSLNQMLWRTVRRLERMRGYELVADKIADELLSEVSSLADDTLFETSIRLVPEDSPQEFLLHTPLRGADYWDAPASPE